MKRNPHIDFLKGITIIAVVIGHCWTVDKSLHNFVYSFHMPFFFCISGYLFSNREPFKEFVISKAKAILKPYVIYFACSCFCTVFIFKYPTTLLQCLQGILLGGKYCMNFYNTPLWYLPLFFISVNTFYLLLKIKPTAMRYALVILGAFSSIHFNKILLEWFPDKFTPFNIQALLPSLFFMFIGYEFKKIDLTKLKNKLSSYGFYATILLMFGLGIILSRDNTDQIISLFMTYEFYIYPLLIIPIILLISCNTRNRHIEFIGSNSITILGFHRLILYIFSDVFGLKNHLTNTDGNSFVVTMFMSALCIFIICVGKIVYDHSKVLIKRGINKRKSN